MKDRRNWLLFFALFCLLQILVNHLPVYASSILDIGTDYRMRGVSISNADFGATSGQSYTYYSQRALAHIGARFSPNIEFMTQFQALGVAGSSATVTDPVASQSATENQAFTLQLPADVFTDVDAGDSFILGCNHPIWPSFGLIHGSRSSSDIWLLFRLPL